MRMTGSKLKRSWRDGIERLVWRKKALPQKKRMKSGQHRKRINSITRTCTSNIILLKSDRKEVKNA